MVSLRDEMGSNDGKQTAECMNVYYTIKLSFATSKYNSESCSKAKSTDQDL